MNQQEKELIALLRRTDETGVTGRDLAQFHDIWDRGKSDREKAQTSLRIFLALRISFIPSIMLGGYSLGASLGQAPQWVATNAIWGGVAGLFSALIAVYLWHYLKILRELKNAF